MVWLGTLGVGVWLGAMAWVPAWWSSVCAAQLGQWLTRVPGSPPVQVQVEADPILGMPAGYIGRLRIVAPGVCVAGIPLGECALSLTPVTVSGWALWGMAEPRLLAPARVEARVTVSEGEVVAALMERVARRQWPVLPVWQVGRMRLGGELVFEAPVISFQGGRCLLETTVYVQEQPRQVHFEVVPRVDERGGLRLDAPRLSIDGLVVPGALYRGALERAIARGWPAGVTDVRFARVDAQDGRLMVSVEGSLDQMPGQAP